MAFNFLGLHSGDGSNRVTSDYLYNNITAATTTVVKSGPGILHSLIVGTASPSGATATIYDNTTASGASVSITAVTTSNNLVYDINLNTGLTIVTSATGNITVAYK